MSTEFTKWNATTHPLIKKDDDYNNIVDHAFIVASDYIVYQDGTNLKAKHGKDGTVPIIEPIIAGDISTASYNIIESILAVLSTGVIYMKEVPFQSNAHADNVTVYERYEGGFKIFSNIGKYIPIPLLDSDPSIVGWGATEDRRIWFLSSGGGIKYWDGNLVAVRKLVQTYPPLADFYAHHVNFGITTGGLYYKITPIGVVTEYSDAALLIESLFGSGSSGVAMLGAGTFGCDTTIDFLGTGGGFGHGVLFCGCGEKTIIKQNNSRNLNALININLNAASYFGRVLFKDFVIDGNKANQTSGNGYGILSDTYSSTEGDYCTFENLLIKDTRGVGIETNGNFHRLINVNVRNAGGIGFIMRDYRTILLACSAQNGANTGFQFRGTGWHKAIACESNLNDLHGYHIYGIDAPSGIMRTQISGNALSNDGHGVLIEGAQRNRIELNLEQSSENVANTYDNVHLMSYSTRHSIRNIIECILVANSKARYHVRENDANQDYNLVHGCQIVDAGVTGNISLQGANSVQIDNI